jgi:predicted lipoprotein with Yx(FWY)xxD motif
MKWIAATSALLATALVLAACGSDYGNGNSSNNNSSSSSSTGQVSTADANGQTVLVDGNGMTLYALSAEKNGKFICTDQKCLAAWHPVNSQAKGVDGLSTVKRPDGKQQVAYKGEPLYTFSGDKQQGDTNGEGFKDVGTWHAVTTSGKPADSGSDSDSGGGGGGYGRGGY